MRIFVDECVDWRLARDIAGHEVKTARQMGWMTIKNGELLALAADAFDVFVTVDRNLSFQQNLPAFTIAVVVSLALAPLLTGQRAANRTLGLLRGLGAAFAVAAVYFTLHQALHGWLAIGAAATSVPLSAWVLASFLVLYAAQAALALRPHGALAQRLHAWFYGGLFLDEWFTRLTLRLWPNRTVAAATEFTAANGSTR